MYPNQMQIYNCGEKVEGDNLPLQTLSIGHGTATISFEISYDTLRAAGSKGCTDYFAWPSEPAGSTLEMVLNEEIVGDYGDLFGAADDDTAEQGFAGTALY